jgi:hypothetical protein
MLDRSDSRCTEKVLPLSLMVAVPENTSTDFEGSSATVKEATPRKMRACSRPLVHRIAIRDSAPSVTELLEHSMVRDCCGPVS